MNGKTIVLPVMLAAFMLHARSAHAQDITGAIVDVLVNGGNDFAWEKVELPGSLCGNGSQYKFFVHRTASPNLLFYFEGGGACWDYDTCSGRAGVLGAANPNGIEDGYMSTVKSQYVSPIVNGADPGLPLRSRTDLVTKDWNVVYLPYCTGDVHVGQSTATYADPTGAEPPLEFHHDGFHNAIAAIDWARGTWGSVDKLLVSGFSAGGTATSALYWFIRQGLPANSGYMLNDSGPIYPAPDAFANSRQLHDKIRQSWNLDETFRTLPASFDRADFGSINRMLATELPNDQLAYTAYTNDYNYSRFSYERFLTPNDKDSVLTYWKEDQDSLVAELGRYENTSWFIAHGRPINDSHCTTIITFIGSHACQQMEKKRRWWEYLEWPPGQSWKCYSEFVPMDVFLQRFVGDHQRTRIYEPPNGYNDEDPGMMLVAPLINAALEG